MSATPAGGSRWHSLAAEFRKGFSPERLFDRYTSFGEDPFIVPLDASAERVEFSAWNYAKERCRELCRNG